MFYTLFLKRINNSSSYLSMHSLDNITKEFLDILQMFYLKCNIRFLNATLKCIFVIVTQVRVIKVIAKIRPQRNYLNSNNFQNKLYSFIFIN